MKSEETIPARCCTAAGLILLSFAAGFQFGFWYGIGTAGVVFLIAGWGKVALPWVSKMGKFYG